MKIRFIALIAVILLSVISLTGCGQSPKGEEEVKEEPKPPEVVDEIEEAPSDYVGVWLRTATYANGAYLHSTPATLTLKENSYTSVGTCSVAGDVIPEGEGSITMTINSTNCQGISSGGSVTYTYTITYDKDRDVEVMTIVTGPVMETYDRQS